MRSVRISPKHARTLIAVVNAFGARSPSEEAALDALRAGLATKPAVRAARKAKAAKRETRKEETARIREVVVRRASPNGTTRCECCNAILVDLGFWPGTGEMDHFFPKGRTPQTVQTCWFLCRQCHGRKTRNAPSAAWWLEAFIVHCDRHGYAAEASRARARLEAIEMTRGNP